MHRIFVPIYKFFVRHKALLWVLLAVTTVVFTFFASKITLEEDITKLLPRAATTNELAFGELRIKDKLFIQLAGEQGMDPSELASCMDEFISRLNQRDSADHYIDNILYCLDSDMAVSALDFALTHVPSFVDTSAYSAIDAALEPDAVAMQMTRNYRAIMSDFTGEATQKATTDPLDLSSIILGPLMGGGGIGGLNIVDNHIFCPDSTIALAFLAPSFNSLDTKSGTALIGGIEKEAERFEKENPGIKIYLHGEPVRSRNNSRRIKQDLLITVGFSLLLILILLAISFKSGTILWQQFVPVLYGTLFALSCMWWIKGGMSLIALGIGAIVLGVAISYCLHVIIHHHYVNDPEKMLRDESTPVFLGAVTTIGAFLGLLFTDSELLKDFGLFASFALTGSTLFALVFLPHMMRPDDTSRNELVFRLVDRVNGASYDRKHTLLWVVTFLVFFGIPFAGKVEFDNDLNNLDYRHPDEINAMKLYEQKNFNGNFQLYFACSSMDLDEALDETRGLMSSLDSLREEGLVKDYSTVVPDLFVSISGQQQRIDAWNAYWTPSKKALARRRISEAAISEGLSPRIFEPFYALLDTEWEPESLFESGIIPESLSSTFIERIEDGTYLVFTPVMMDEKDKVKVEDRLVKLPGAIAMDPFYYCADMVDIIHSNFSITLMISSLFVLLVLIFSFRNFWIALIAFLPMFISWYVVEGYMFLLGIKFNLISIVISTFIFGIGVDYSIFVMEGLLAQARRGDKGMILYHKVAIFFSAMVLAIVVCSLLFAVDPAIKSIGLSTVIGMTSTIVITYTLQPFVFRQLMKLKYFRRSFKVPEKTE